ncbi:MAG: hypothetical protein KBS99_01175 [Prevotellaceae bacterium]|nr:hypothetical protein [Candidatus Colivivens caballi]
MKRYFYLLALCTACFFALSCSDDDSPNSSSDSDGSATDTTIVSTADTTKIVLRFEDFIDENDVTIESADSAQIFVSARYADDMKFNFQKRNLVIIWRAQNEIPFVRRITGIHNVPNGYLLDTKFADFGDVFTDGNFKFDTSDYVNFSEAEQTNGHINANRYYDRENNTYHPTLIIVPVDTAFDENEENLLCDDAEGKYCTRSDAQRPVKYRVITAEDIVKRTRALAGTKFNFVDIHPTIRNRTLNIDDVGGCKIRLNTLELRVNGGLEINVDVRWFKLRKFEAYLQGGALASVDLDATLGISGPHEFKDRELGTFPSYTSVFMVGPIPVAISFIPKVLFKHSVVGAVGIQIPFKAAASASFKVGPKYEYDKGWDFVATGSDTAYASPIQIRVDGDCTYSAGVYASASVKLYGSAGPVLLVGPKFVTSFKAYFSSSEQDPGAIESSGKMIFGGTLGAEISIWKWKIAGCSFEYNLIEEEMWNVRFPMPSGESKHREYNGPYID